MDEREELVQQLKEELKWVKYRTRMLDIIEEKLLKMRRMAEIAIEENLSADEVEAINSQIKDLEEQVKAFDSESKRIEDRKIFE